MRQKISPKFHVKNGVKKTENFSRKFHSAGAQNVSAQKKFLAPPPRNSPQIPSRPLGPSWKPPPLLGFSIKTDPPRPPGASDSPFPPPRAKKKKNPKRPPSKFGLCNHQPRNPPSPFWQLTRTIYIYMLWSEFCRGGNSDHGLSFLFSTDLQYF